MTEPTTGTAPQAPANIMARLKSSTDDHHRRAEGRALQRDLMKGVLPRAAYAAYLGELLLIHKQLEGRLRDRADAHPALPAVFRPYHARADDLRTDLEFYGHEPAPATEATKSLLVDIDRWAREEPVTLLGPLYVLEGSMNGNQFIARVLMKAWSLAPGPGLRYLTPYGDQQPANWAQFRADMNAAAFTAKEQEAIIAAAQRTFDGIAAIADAVAG